MLINNDINNRYAIFVFYDRDGIVDEYNYVLLLSLIHISEPTRPY